MDSYENVFLILNNKLKINVMTSEDSLCGILNVSSAERVKAHYEGARTHLLNSNEILRRTSHEQDLYSKYSQAGEPNGPTIYSSKGIFLNEILFT